MSFVFVFCFFLLCRRILMCILMLFESIVVFPPRWSPRRSQFTNYSHRIHSVHWHKADRVLHMCLRRSARDLLYIQYSQHDTAVYVPVPTPSYFFILSMLFSVTLFQWPYWAQFKCVVWQISHVLCVRGQSTCGELSDSITSMYM